MPKLLSRIVAVLLIPCLAMDPTFAHVTAQTAYTGAIRLKRYDNAPFLQQAVMAPLVDVRPEIAGRTWSRVLKLYDSALSDVVPPADSAAPAGINGSDIIRTFSWIALTAALWALQHFGLISDSQTGLAVFPFFLRGPLRMPMDDPDDPSGANEVVPKNGETALNNPEATLRFLSQDVEAILQQKSLPSALEIWHVLDTAHALFRAYLEAESLDKETRISRAEDVLRQAITVYDQSANRRLPDRGIRSIHLIFDFQKVIKLNADRKAYDRAAAWAREFEEFFYHHRDDAVVTLRGLVVVETVTALINLMRQQDSAGAAEVFRQLDNFLFVNADIANIHKYSLEIALLGLQLATSSQRLEEEPIDPMPAKPSRGRRVRAMRNDRRRDEALQIQRRSRESTRRASRLVKSSPREAPRPQAADSIPVTQEPSSVTQFDAPAAMTVTPSSPQPDYGGWGSNRVSHGWWYRPVKLKPVTPQIRVWLPPLLRIYWGNASSIYVSERTVGRVIDSLMKQSPEAGDVLRRLLFDERGRLQRRIVVNDHIEEVSPGWREKQLKENDYLVLLSPIAGASEGPDPNQLPEGSNAFSSAPAPTAVFDLEQARTAAHAADALYESEPGKVRFHHVMMELRQRYDGGGLIHADLVVDQGQGILIVGKSDSGKSNMAHGFALQGAEFGGRDAIELIRIGKALVGGVTFSFKNFPLDPRRNIGSSRQKEFLGIKPHPQFVPITTVVAMRFSRQVAGQSIRAYSALADATGNMEVRELIEMCGASFHISQVFEVTLPPNVSVLQIKSVAADLLQRIQSAPLPAAPKVVYDGSPNPGPMRQVSATAAIMRQFLLHPGQSMTKLEIVDATGLSRKSINERLPALEASGLLQIAQEKSGPIAETYKLHYVIWEVFDGFGSSGLEVLSLRMLFAVFLRRTKTNRAYDRTLPELMHDVERTNLKRIKALLFELERMGLTETTGVSIDHRSRVKINHYHLTSTIREILPSVAPNPQQSPEGSDQGHIRSLHSSAADKKVLSPSPKATVLIAEDEEPTRRLLAVSLEEEGYRVLAAADGEEALKLYQQEPSGTIPVVITDGIMPKMGGQDLFENIRAINPQQPIIFTTDMEGIIAYVQQAYTHVDVLSKPYKLREIIKLIEKYTARPNPEQRLEGPSHSIDESGGHYNYVVLSGGFGALFAAHLAGWILVGLLIPAIFWPESSYARIVQASLQRLRNLSANVVAYVAHRISGPFLRTPFLRQAA